MHSMGIVYKLYGLCSDIYMPELIMHSLSLFNCVQTEVMPLLQLPKPIRARHHHPAVQLLAGRWLFCRQSP